MKRLIIPAVAVLAAGASGCTPAQCDPNNAGFLSGIGCEASGSYTARNQAQQSALAQSRAQALAERANASEARQEAYSAQMTLDQRRSALRSLDAQTADLRRRLQAARARSANQAQVSQAQAQLDEIQRQRASLPAAPSPDQLRDLDQRRRNLLDIVTQM